MEMVGDMATEENNIEELIRNLDSAYRSESAYLDTLDAGDKLVELARRGLDSLDEGKLREMLLVPHTKEYWRGIHSGEIKNGEIPARPHYCDSDEKYADWLAAESASREEGKKEWIRRALACSATKRYAEDKDGSAIRELLHAQTNEDGQADGKTIWEVFSSLIGYYEGGANLDFLKPLMKDVLEGRYRSASCGWEAQDAGGFFFSAPVHDDNTCATVKGTVKLLREMAEKEGIEIIEEFMPGLSRIIEECNVKVPHCGSHGMWWRWPYRESQRAAQGLMDAFTAMKATAAKSDHAGTNPLARDGIASKPPRSLKTPPGRGRGKLKH